MNPSQDQVKSALRSLGAAFGGLIAGYAAGHGWMTQEQAVALLNNEQFLSTSASIVLALIGLAGSAAAMIRSVIARKQSNMIATVAAMPDKKQDMVAEVAAMPEVAKVEMMPTQAGVAIADAIPPMPGAIVTVAPSSRR